MTSDTEAWKLSIVAGEFEPAAPRAIIKSSATQSSAPGHAGSSADLFVRIRFLAGDLRLANYSCAFSFCVITGRFMTRTTEPYTIPVRS